jgi:predicted secreted protein
MFTDGRSKSVIFVAHCVLNQNSISDGTAKFPGSIKEILHLLSSSPAGIVQMPCPELMCLGLDRGSIDGANRPVVQENTRIRGNLNKRPASETVRRMAQDLVFQVSEYHNHGFDILGIVGINRSPSCGVDSTSKDNQEVVGRGVFVEALHKELKGREIPIVGIKASEPEKAVAVVRNLLRIKG